MRVDYKAEENKAKLNCSAEYTVELARTSGGSAGKYRATSTACKSHGGINRQMAQRDSFTTSREHSLRRRSVERGRWATSGAGGGKGSTRVGKGSGSEGGRQRGPAEYSRGKHRVPTREGTPSRLRGEGGRQRGPLDSLAPFGGGAITAHNTGGLACTQTEAHTGAHAEIREIDIRL